MEADATSEDVECPAELLPVMVAETTVEGMRPGEVTDAEEAADAPLTAFVPRAFVGPAGTVSEVDADASQDGYVSALRR